MGKIFSTVLGKRCTISMYLSKGILSYNWWRSFNDWEDNKFYYTINKAWGVRKNVISYHCIIHQRNLASLHTETPEKVKKDIVDIINFICSHALNHRQFRELLNEYDAHYSELVYHSQVRWLSKGVVIDHFFHLI